MKLFGVLLTVDVIVGALVGGVVGILLPKISTGLSLGLLVSLFCGVLIYGSNTGDASVGVEINLALFAFLIIGSIFATQKFEMFCSSIRIALATGLGKI
jgi:hypothetical protein